MMKLKQERKSRRESKPGRTRLLFAAAFAGYVAAAFLAHGPSLPGPFIFDDLHAIRDNPAIREHLNPLWFFAHPESASREPSTMVRPLLVFSYSLDYRAHGLSARGFRATNIFIHGLNSYLVFVLLLRMGMNMGLSFLGGLLFLAHPLAVMSTAYVSNRSTLLSSSFYLLGLLAAERYLRGRKEGRHFGSLLSLAGCALFYGFGLCAKPVAATLPVAVFLWALAFERDEQGELKSEALKRASICAAVLFLVLSGYIAYRRASAAPTFFPPARPHPVIYYAGFQARAFWTYLRMMFLPAGLSLEHEAAIPASPSFFISPEFLLSCGGLILFSAAGMVLLKAKPAAGFSLLFFALYLVPGSSVIPLVVPVNENRTYLSLLLFSWTLPEAASAVDSKRGGRLGLCVLLIALLFLVLQSRERAAGFQNELSLWREAVKQAPSSTRSWNNLGAAWLSYGKSEQAERCFLRALKLNPCSAPALNNLANIILRRGESKQAEKLYKDAIKCDPMSPEAYLNLFDLLLEEGREREALKGLQKLPPPLRGDPRVKERRTRMRAGLGR